MWVFSLLLIKNIVPKYLYFCGHFECKFFLNSSLNEVIITTLKIASLYIYFIICKFSEWLFGIVFRFSMCIIIPKWILWLSFSTLVLLISFSFLTILTKIPNNTLNWTGETYYFSRSEEICFPTFLIQYIGCWFVVYCDFIILRNALP